MHPVLSASSPTPERLHGLDAVRALALLLGVVLHAAMSFMPGAQFFWIVSDNDPHLLPGLLFYVIHTFRMLLFFLIAGLFGRLLLEKLGTGGFIRDRLRRIGLPLVCGWGPVFAAIVAVVVWAAWIKNGGSLPAESPPGPKFTPDDFPLTHLWFLYVLLLCYAGALLLRRLAGAVDRGGHLQAFTDRAVRVLTGPAGPLLLAIPLAASLYLHPLWYAWFGIPTPDHSLYPNRAALTAFGCAFALGWLMQRQAGLLPRLQRQWPLHLAMAVIATGACLLWIGPVTPPLPADRSLATLAYAGGYALAGWSWSFALIGLSLRFASGYSPVRRYVADASYWIYLAHLPLVMVMQVLVARLEWSWALKLPAVVLATLALLLLSYHGLVRYTWLGAVLHGRRRPRPTASPQPAITADPV